MVNSQATVLSYLDGDLPEEQLSFEFNLMKAWCSGNISAFLESQRKELTARVMGAKERTLLNELIDLALTRESETLKGVAAMNLAVYFEGLSEKDRIDKFDSMIRVFKYSTASE